MNLEELFKSRECSLGSKITTCEAMNAAESVSLRWRSRTRFCQRMFRKPFDNLRVMLRGTSITGMFARGGRDFAVHPGHAVLVIA